VLAECCVAVSGLDDLIDMSSAVDPGMGGRAGILLLSKDEAFWDVNGRCTDTSLDGSLSGAVCQEDGLSSCSLVLLLFSSKPKENSVRPEHFGPEPGLDREVEGCILSTELPSSPEELNDGVPWNTGSCHLKVGEEKPVNICE